MARGNISLMGVVSRLNSKSNPRTLGERDKKRLYDLANHRCENCDKKIQYDEMQSGHKKAYSKGGKAILSNSVCLCYRCNNNQGKDSWEKFRKIQNKPITPTATDHLKIKRTRIATTKKKREINIGLRNPF